MSKIPKLSGLAWRNLGAVAAVVVAIGLIAAKNLHASAADPLLNVSYDPTRELYQSIDKQFAAKYQAETGEAVSIRQSHGGSSRQSRAVISGEQPADVVTLGLYSDVDALRKRGLVAEGWADRLPHHSQPYFSTIVFVVRRNNPKNIRDWPDLIKPGVFVITPNPRTSGNGKLSALAAWAPPSGAATAEDDARAYLKALYQQCRCWTPARAAPPTLSRWRISATFISPGRTRRCARSPSSKGDLEIVHPPVSIIAEPYVAWVDANVARHKTEALAKAYLEYLFTDEAQETIAKLGFRPINAAILDEIFRPAAEARSLSHHPDRQGLGRREPEILRRQWRHRHRAAAGDALVLRLPHGPRPQAHARPHDAKNARRPLQPVDPLELHASRAARRCKRRARENVPVRNVRILCRGHRPSPCL